MSVCEARGLRQAFSPVFGSGALPEDCPNAAVVLAWHSVFRPEVEKVLPYYWLLCTGCALSWVFALREHGIAPLLEPLGEELPEVLRGCTG